jgi:hypothetical protein
LWALTKYRKWWSRSSKRIRSTSVLILTFSDSQLSSLGLEASVNVGSLVAHDGEHVVGEDATDFLIVDVGAWWCGGYSTIGHWLVRGLQCFLNVFVELEHGMLVEEVSKTYLLVGDEGSNLGGEVGSCAWDESGVRESVVKWEEELSGSAILELSHQLDTSVLQLGHHLSWVVLPISVLWGIEGISNLGWGHIASLEACGCGISLIVLEGKAATEVNFTDGISN